MWPDAQVSALPLADGGEGTLDAVAACGGEIVTCEVAGPLGKRVAARMLVDGEHESAVIEMAEAAGIGYCRARSRRRWPRRPMAWAS